ncbi:cryptococcal mannosyltransferase 1-domain-containing protein [Schizophyllum commune]
MKPALAILAAVHIVLCVLGPVLLACYIFNRAYEYWLDYVGNGVWEPAWPKARTRFVLCMVTVPIWGLCMAGGTLLWETGKRAYATYSARHWRAHYRALNDTDEDYSKTRARVNRGEGRGTWIALSLYGSLALFGLFLLATYEQPVDHRFKQDIALANRSPRPEGYGDGEKVFIAAMFHNNAGVIPYWTEQCLKLIHYLGTENVYVSIVESHSTDNSPDLLRQFDAALSDLHVEKRILVNDKTTSRPSTMDTSPARIQYLAAVRNLALEPLVERGGFERVLFSNDIFIKAESMLELLKTRDGDYDMACAVDLSFWGLYDAWVVRDSIGRIPSSLWPYLADEEGMSAIKKNEPAPVFTCWNGIVSIRADPFLPIHLRRPNSLSTEPLSHPLPESHPAYPQPPDLSPAGTLPLRFRHSSPNECFSSESFNLPYDLRRQFDLTGIYLNPRVITSYDWNFFVWYKYVTRHWLVKWFIERVEEGAGMKDARMIIGDANNIWTWDGGECQPVRSFHLMAPEFTLISPQWW